jgi:hypothetical protein
VLRRFGWLSQAYAAAAAAQAGAKALHDQAQADAAAVGASAFGGFGDFSVRPKLSSGRSRGRCRKSRGR